MPPSIPRGAGCVGKRAETWSLIAATRRQGQTLAEVVTERVKLAPDAIVVPIVLAHNLLRSVQLQALAQPRSRKRTYAFAFRSIAPALLADRAIAWPASTVRATGRWRGLMVSEFEHRQLKAIRVELDRGPAWPTPGRPPRCRPVGWLDPSAAH